MRNQLKLKFKRMEATPGTILQDGTVAATRNQSLKQKNKMNNLIANLLQKNQLTKK